MLAIRAEKYASTFQFIGESALDVSCGDGIFSFIAAGGELHESCDMFQSLNTSSKRLGNHDVFDCYDDDYKVTIAKQPTFAFSHGSDWKQNLISKAAKLGWYQKLIVHDNNRRFKFDDSSFDYIYSNSAYWVDSFETHIRDLSRMLKSGGHLILELKTSSIERFMLGSYAPFLLGGTANALIDGGRRSTWKGLRSLDEYCRLFDQIDSLQVVFKEPVYGGLIAKIWDIGLRPLFNPLSTLANSCDAAIRANAKREWNHIVLELFSEFVENYSIKDDEAIEFLFVLKKR